MTDQSQEGLGVVTACSAAAQFIKLYYEFIDKARHNLAKLYLSEAVLVWNGIEVKGSKDIMNFFEKKVPTSQHLVKCFDSQPAHRLAVGTQSTMLVTAQGSVNFDGDRNDFYQSFLITSQDDNWKVVSDTFRIQQPVPI